MDDLIRTHCLMTYSLSLNGAQLCSQSHHSLLRLQRPSFPQVLMSSQVPGKKYPSRFDFPANYHVSTRCLIWTQGSPDALTQLICRLNLSRVWIHVVHTLLPPPLTVSDSSMTATVGQWAWTARKFLSSLHCAVNSLTVLSTRMSTFLLSSRSSVLPVAVECILEVCFLLFPSMWQKTVCMFFSNKSV